MHLKATMFAATQEGHSDSQEQLLRLYWNRAGVKRELSNLKRERFDLLDRLKEQEGAITRAKEQLEGLERLLTNPLAAANAMVYFQLRHLWRLASLRLEQFGKELQLQRERRERAQLHEAALAKRQRRLGAISEKLHSLVEKRQSVIDECATLEQRLTHMNALMRLLQGRKQRRRIQGLQAGQVALDERVEECNELIEKIKGEPLPEPEDLSLESRRLINLAVIAFAQHLVVHFAESDLASLAKAAMRKPVADMKFGDRRTCDRMVERIQERIEELNASKNIAEVVKKRTDRLIVDMRYRHETDATPDWSVVDRILVTLGGDDKHALRRTSDAPLSVNVLEDNYWDLKSVLR
jgi:chromosome segregation ATPase